MSKLISNAKGKHLPVRSFEKFLRRWSYNFCLEATTTANVLYETLEERIIFIQVDNKFLSFSDCSSSYLYISKAKFVELNKKIIMSDLVIFLYIMSGCENTLKTKHLIPVK